MLTVKSNLRPTISRFFDDDWNSLFDWSNRNFSSYLLPAVNIRETAQYLHQEFQYREFERTFNLNKNLVDGNSIHAKYDNGILVLTLPKKEEAKEKSPRLIDIS